MSRVSWMFALLLAAWDGTTRADVVAYEGFDYATGTDLSGQSGGTGFLRSWALGGVGATIDSNYGIEDGSLAFQDLATTGNRVTSGAVKSVQGSTPDLGGSFRGMAQSFGTGDTFYLSVLLRPEGTLGEGNFGGFFGLYLNSAVQGAPDLFLGKPGNRDQYVLEERGGTGQFASNYTAAVGQTVLLVLKGELLSGNDRFTLWVNRPPDGPDPSSFDAMKLDIDLGSFESIVIYSTGAFSIDEIRLGTTYASVTPVPEPGSLALVALGALAIGVRRRARG